MIAVMGYFRMPPERLKKARSAMRKVVDATRAEDGCIAYSYAEDVLEPGLIRVCEQWESRAHLAAHFESAHMREWAEVRAGLGLTDRQINCHELGEPAAL